MCVGVVGGCTTKTNEKKETDNDNAELIILFKSGQRLQVGLGGFVRLEDITRSVLAFTFTDFSEKSIAFIANYI